MKKSVSKKLILFVLIFFFFFSYSIIICWDSAHYTTMGNILSGKFSFSSYDVARGFTFPLLINISKVIFGESPFGLSLFVFCFYLILLYFVSKISHSVFKDNTKKDSICRVAILLFTILNPIIFGYFHTLLTEFVAITLSIVFSYLAWKWMQVESISSKEGILYTIIFSIFIMLSWFLKQPYISVTLFPLLIASILSIIQNHKKKNIILRISTIFISVIVLCFSIFIWNGYLERHGVNLNSNRNSSNLLGNQIIFAIDHYELEKDDTKYTLDAINSNKYLFSSEKKKLQENDSYRIINIYSFQEKIIDQSVILMKNGNVSGGEGIKFVVSNFFSHPLLTLESYFANYMSIINVYSTTSPDGVDYFVNRKIDFNFVAENKLIAYNIYEDGSNIFYMTDELRSNVMKYEIYKSPSPIINLLMKGLTYVYNYIFKLAFVLLPFVLISTIVSFMKGKNRKDREKLNFVFILLMYSFMHLMVHVVVGARIDRYASPAFLTTLIGYVIYFSRFYGTKKLGANKK